MNKILLCLPVILASAMASADCGTFKPVGEALHELPPLFVEKGDALSALPEFEELRSDLFAKLRSIMMEQRAVRSCYQPDLDRNVDAARASYEACKDEPVCLGRKFRPFKEAQDLANCNRDNTRLLSQLIALGDEQLNAAVYRDPQLNDSANCKRDPELDDVLHLQNALHRRLLEANSGGIVHQAVKVLKQKPGTRVRGFINQHSSGHSPETLEPQIFYVRGSVEYRLRIAAYPPQLAIHENGGPFYASKVPDAEIAAVILKESFLVNLKDGSSNPKFLNKFAPAMSGVNDPISAF